MTEFIVVDRLLYRPVLRWLSQQTGLRSTTHDGVTVYSSKSWNLILVDPEDFSLGSLSVQVRRAMERDTVLNVIVGSIVQYFASKMKKRDDIFTAINVLSRHPVVVVDAPVFRIQSAFEETGKLARFKHEVSFAAFPSNMSKVSTQYVQGHGLVREADLGLPKAVSSVAVPLIFHNSAFAQQVIAGDHLIPAVDPTQDFERLAFDQLMLRFPSRTWASNELKALSLRLGLEEDDVREVWKHNRDQWQLVIDKLKAVGVVMPTPARFDEKLPKPPQYDQFTHLVLSNFFKLSARIDAEIPMFRHIGLPLFARNGVTIPFGNDGIIESADSVPDDILVIRTNLLLPDVLGARLKEPVSRRSKAVVTP